MWPFKKKKQPSKLLIGNARYDENPFYLIFENYVLGAIGHLPPETGDRIQQMDLQKTFSTQAQQWQEVVREALEVSDTIDIEIMDEWIGGRNRYLDEGPGYVAFAQDFATGFFSGTKTKTWTNESLEAAKERIKQFRSQQADGEIPSTQAAREVEPLIPFGEPFNELEKTQLLKYEKKIGIVEFLKVLLESEAWVVTRKDQLEIVGGEVRLKKDPQFFTQVLRGQHHLGVFTDAARSGAAPSIPAEFECAIPMPFRSILEFLDGTDVGMILNPYYEKNMSWDSSQIVEILKM